MSTAPARAAAPAALPTRLGRLGGLDAADLAALARAQHDTRRSPARREMIAEGAALRERRAIVSGWAFRQRILSDGSRQIISVLLPGDLVGVCRHDNPVAPTSVVALTDVVTCPAPVATPGSGLDRAYALSAAIDEFHLTAQVTRLGRLNAIGRVADWLLETHDRLRLAGLGGEETFPMPLTQEMLADALGLTSVHVNRTLQAMRRDELIHARSGVMTFPNRARLEDMVDYRPVRVTSNNLMSA